MEDPTSCHESRAHPENLPTSLPPEIWRKIISFTVRSSLASRIDLKDVFDSSYIHETERAILLDRRNLSRVSSSWRSAVAEISAEDLTITNEKALTSIIDAFERSKIGRDHSGSHLGEWTRRIHEAFSVTWQSVNNAHLTRLLKCTPNLLIYSHEEGWRMPNAEYNADDEVLDTLIMHCGHSLQRIRWKTVGNSFRYHNIVKLDRFFPNLVTLCLEIIWPNFQLNLNGLSDLLYFSKLENLSLGSSPPRGTAPAETWEHFFRSISSDSSQLPSLKRFDCDGFPLTAISFFYVHGHKLRHFRTSQLHENNISDAVELCPRLESLVIDKCRQDTCFPLAHPTLEKICICSCVEASVSTTAAPAASLRHVLESIEKMDAPRLKEVRLRHIGLYDAIKYRYKWPRHWWRRLDTRGCRFVDETGASFENLYDSDEDL